MKKSIFLLRIAAFMLALELIIAGCGSSYSYDDDTTSPANVTELTAIVGNEKITLSWVDPIDEDFDRVEITYKPGGSSRPIIVKKGIITSEFIGLTNETKYTFTVKSVDASGNKSSGVVKDATAGNIPLVWTAVGDSKFGTTSNISDIAYGGGKFVAVGGGGTMVYSANGTVWVKVGRSPFSTDIYGITYGNNKFFAVGAEGKMAYSSNGTNWTEVKGAVEDSENGVFGNSTIYSIAYGGDKFVAVGGGGKIAYSTSTTGTVWNAVWTIEEGTGTETETETGTETETETETETGTETEIGTETETEDNANGIFGGSAIYRITYGDDKFVAVGDKGKMAYSSDGISWTKVEDSTFDESAIYSIAYSDGKFVAVGAEGKMAYSSDGISWTKVGDSGFGTNSIRAITNSKDRFVIVGENYQIASSPDGISWIPATDSLFDDGNFYGIAYGGGRFAAVGTAGKVASSNDIGQGQK